jgi:endonuclease VIII
MPEGDTLFRIAAGLRRALVGETVLEARARPGPMLRRVPDLSVLAGLQVRAVESKGKHLLVRFGDGPGSRTLRTHLRMSGSWHRYRPGEPWRLPERRATVVLGTEHAVAVCFDCPTAELLTDAGLARSKPLTTLGPDLLGPAFDADLALANLRDRGDVAIGEALLDQRALAGIGNVVRNEVLFMERVSPWAPVRSLSGTQLAGLVSAAQRVLRSAARDGDRTTTGDRRRGARLWVYGRAGRPCRRCGTRIEVSRQGELRRLIYWCPSCQPGPPPKAAIS